MTSTTGTRPLAYEIYRSLYKDGKAHAPVIADRIDRSRGTVHNYLTDMEEDGMIVEDRKAFLEQEGKKKIFRTDAETLYKWWKEQIEKQIDPQDDTEQDIIEKFEKYESEGKYRKFFVLYVSSYLLVRETITMKRMLFNDLLAQLEPQLYSKTSGEGKYKEHEELIILHHLMGITDVFNYTQPVKMALHTEEQIESGEIAISEPLEFKEVQEKLTE